MGDEFISRDTRTNGQESKHGGVSSWGVPSTIRRARANLQGAAQFVLIIVAGLTHTEARANWMRSLQRSAYVSLPRS